MISIIRSYIKSQILANYPDLKENKSAFYDDDIGETLIDRSYQITISNITNTLRTDYREYEVPCTLSIFGTGFRNEISNYDTLLDKALCILDNIIDLRKFETVPQIVNVFNGSILSEQLINTDNSFKVDINFTVTIAYTE